MPKKKRERYVRVCPRCGSTRTTRTYSEDYFSPYFFCKDCNFSSVLFPEINIKDIKKLPKMPPSPKYLMWRRPATDEVKPLERTMRGKNRLKNPFVALVYTFLIILLVIIFVLEFL